MNAEIVKEYEAHLDTKGRITLRGAENGYFAVKMFRDGRVLLNPCILVPQDAVSKKTLTALDQAVKNFKQGKVSAPIDLDKYL